MNITIKKNKNEVSLKIKDKGVDCTFNGLSDDNLNLLREQIDEALNSPRTAARVWNPRSRRHDIIEQ